MTRRPVGRLAVRAVPVALLLSLTACSESPDLGEVERTLADVDGVVDADAAWFDGSWKVADASAVSVAVGDDLAEGDVAQLAEDLTEAVDGLELEVEPNLAIELDDDADAVSFLSSFPGDQNAAPPTDISTYTVHAANLDDRDLGSDLRFLLRARELLGAPVQVEYSDEDVLDATAGVTTSATELTAVLHRLVADPVLAVPARWRITGPDVLVESGAGLTTADVSLWSRLLSESESLGGLDRTQAALSVSADRRLTVVRVAVRADGLAAGATQAVTQPARQLSARLERLGVDQVDVVVAGTDEMLTRAFYQGGQGSWQPYEVE